MRVIPDVNVLLRAVLQPDGPAREILRLLALGPHRLILSRHIVDTAREKLALPRIRKRSQASNELLDYFVEATLEISLHVIPAEGPPIVPGDHEGDIVVYTAVAGRADVICTWAGISTSRTYWPSADGAASAFAATSTY